MVELVQGGQKDKSINTTRKKQIWDGKFHPKNIKILSQLVFETEIGTKKILSKKWVSQQI